MPSQGGTGAAAVIAAAAASSTNATSTATRVVVLKNMPITEEELANDEDYEEILEDTKDECSSFGMLKNIEIPRTGDGKGRIFLEYLTKDDAANAIRQLRVELLTARRLKLLTLMKPNLQKEITVLPAEMLEKDSLPCALN